MEVKQTCEDAPTAPCEECHVPLELDISIATADRPPTRSQRHLCASCRRDQDREKWLDKDDIRIRGGRTW